MTPRQLLKKIVRRAFAKPVDGKVLEGTLRRLGVRAGADLLVHSSFASLGYVRGGPEAFIDVLRNVIGVQGTLILPTHSWHQMNSGCRHFDVRTTPSCVGLLTETFRNLPGVVRSLHPTHSVAAWGPLQQWFVEGHEDAPTPCGAGSPYAKLCERGGQILFLGTTLKSNTTFHTAEALADVPYLMESSADDFEIVDGAGAVQLRSFRLHAQRIGRKFDSFIDALAEVGALRKGPVGNAASLLVEAGPMVNWTVSGLHDNPSMLCL